MNKRSVVSYTLDQCVKCLKCVKACPSSALSMIDNRIIVSDERCLNCGKCISACHNKGLLAPGSTLSDIDNYDYTVCMVPSALTSNCASKTEAEQLFHAIKLLGFDEVVDISAVEGAVMNENYRLADELSSTSVIASFCPVINRLIEYNYPMLLNHLAPLNYPSEIAAKMIRERLKDHGKVGIFNLCECEARLELAKYPYGNDQFETDHALATVDILPDIQRNMETGFQPLSLSRRGLQSCNPALMKQRPDYLIADGFDKSISILDLAEFDLLKSFKLLYLFPCFNGCVGGHLLFGNSYIARNNIHELVDLHNDNEIEIPFEYLYTEETAITKEEKTSFIEKVNFFNKVNEQLELLPGYDCSACGMQTCRIMAEEIVKGNRQLIDCRILAAIKEDPHEHKKSD